MLKKIKWLAEQAATRASRRQFLGNVGRGAMTVAAIVAGVLAVRGEAAAVSACGIGADTYCRGLVEGAHCQIGTTSGICRGSPACRCVPVQPSRGGGGGRPPRR